MTMPQREVTLKGRKYKFYLIPGGKAFEASRKITAKASTLFPCLWNGKIEEFNTKLLELVMEDFDYLFNTFLDKNNIYCDNILINDFDEHFAGRFMDIPQLLYKVILENDRDFFSSLPSLIERGLHRLNEKLQANSLQKPEAVEEALTTMANKIRENLG